MAQSEPLEAVDEREDRTRTQDYTSSIEGSRSVAYRAGTQKARLLKAFGELGDATDEEAAKRAGISLLSCYWKRCGELRADGLIEWVYAHNDHAQRRGNAGTFRNLSRITAPGVDAHRRMTQSSLEHSA